MTTKLISGDKAALILKDTAAPSGGNGGLNITVLTSDTNSPITETPHPGASQAHKDSLRSRQEGIFFLRNEDEISSRIMKLVVEQCNSIVVNNHQTQFPLFA